MDIENITPIEMVTQTKQAKVALLEYHKEILRGIPHKNFEGMLKQIVTPTLVGLYGDVPQGVAVRGIQTYVEELIPKIKTPKTEKLFDNAGAPIVDKHGKQIEQYVKGPDGKIEQVDVPAFGLTLGAYNKLGDMVKQTHDLHRMYWKARHFVEQHLSNINEVMFDKMNDYLWRNIMAAKYPDDVKREFKHLCINIKRKLYYLGDRDEVHNQTVFGLYSSQGGTGKSTLLKAFCKSFSNRNGFELTKMDDFFKFNGDTSDKFGVLFVDEEAKGQKFDVKNMLKQFIDSDERRVEKKGVDPFKVKNLLTLVVSANHKIAPSLFEDEARGQRRDATFEVIGNLQQYSEKDMIVWFDKMFDVCPFDDDFKTYHHSNPHHNEIQDREYTALIAIMKHKPIGGYEYKSLGEWKKWLDFQPGSDEYWGLRTVLNIPQLFNTKKARGTTLFQPNIEEIEHYLSGSVSQKSWYWSIGWRNMQPWFDPKEVIYNLSVEDTYDCSSPIDYEKYLVTNTTNIDDTPTQVGGTITEKLSEISNLFNLGGL